MSVLEQLRDLRVLFLNWRDTSHPQAGGAEVYCEELAKRFARAGATVTLFTSSYPEAPLCEYVGGVRTLRAGGKFGVYAAAARHLSRHRHEYDAVVDFQNGIPFFSPLFTGPGIASICVVHHVHQDQFDLVFPYPQNVVGKLLEKQVSRAVYAQRPLVAVSPSTKAELRRVLGFRGQIHVVPNGVQPLVPTEAPRTPHPSIGVVTRLVPQKRMDLLIRLMPQLLRRHPDLRLDIAGSGPERDSLQQLIAELGLERSVTLHGYVSEQRKSELLAGAWLTVVPSHAEGWGLTVLEANSLGTPAIAFDVPGLRDSICDGLTGWLVPDGGDLAAAISSALDELDDPPTRDAIEDQCRTWAGRFSWDSSADRLARVVVAEVDRLRSGHRSRRQAEDVSVLVRLPLADPHSEQLLRRRVRRTDLVRRVDDGLEVLLHDCDEVEAAALLHHLGVPDAEFDLARRTDVLTGTRAFA